MRSTRALALPEVLAATAILTAVASLAAPALQGAKPKTDPSTADISRIKQLATGLLIYESDADEVAPDAFAEGPNIRTATAYFPAYNSQPAKLPLFRASETHWSTALWPYVKNADVYASASAPLLGLAANGLPKDWKPRPTAFQFNGLLSHMPATEVAAPAALPLFTESLGNKNVLGLASSNPELNCRAGEPCRFTPPVGGRCSEGANGATSRLVELGFDQRFTAGLDPAKRYGDGYQMIAYADGHAKRIALPKTGEASDPALWWWSRLDAKGRPAAYWQDPEGCHPARFRPDREFTTGAQETPAKETPR